MSSDEILHCLLFWPSCESPVDPVDSPSVPGYCLLAIVSIPLIYVASNSYYPKELEIASLKLKVRYFKRKINGKITFT